MKYLVIVPYGSDDDAKYVGTEDFGAAKEYAASCPPGAEVIDLDEFHKAYEEHLRQTKGFTIQDFFEAIKTYKENEHAH